MNYNSKSKKCFDILLNANNEEEIINIINNADIKFNTLKTSVTNYCIVYNKLEYENCFSLKLAICLMKSLAVTLSNAISLFTRP